MWAAPWGCLISTNPGAKSLLPPGDLGLLRFSVRNWDKYILREAGSPMSRKAKAWGGWRESVQRSYLDFSDHERDVVVTSVIHLQG